MQAMRPLVQAVPFALFLSANVLFAKAASHDGAALEARWASPISILKPETEAEWQGLQATLTNPLTPTNTFWGFGLNVEKETTQEVSKTIPQKAGNAPAKNKAARPSRARRLLKPLALSAFLLLGIALVAAGLKQVVVRKVEPPPKEEPAPSEVHVDPALAEAFKRLAQVQKLLPAAERLAFAVDSAESRRLLEVVQDIVARSDEWKAEQADKDLLEKALSEVLGALKKLHRTAVERAKAEVEAIPSFPHLTPSGPDTLDNLFELEHGVDPEFVRPFVRTFRSLLVAHERLKGRLEFLAKRLKAKKPVENEKQGEDAMLSSVKDLECLLSTSNSIKHIVAVSKQMKDETVAAVKTGLLGERDTVLANLEGQFEIIKLRLALSRSAFKKDGDEAVGEKLWRMEKQLKEMDVLLEHARGQVEKARTCVRLDEAVRYWLNAVQMEELAENLSTKLIDGISELSAMPDQISDDVKKQVLDLGKNFKEKIADVDRTANDARREMAHIKVNRKQTASTGGKSYLSDSFFSSMLANMESLQKTQKVCMEDASMTLSLLKFDREPISALKNLGRIFAHVRSQAAAKRRFVHLVQCARLYGLLEEETHHLIQQKDHAGLGVSELGAYEIDKFASYEQQFDAAKSAAETAQTLLQTAEAVATMRTHIFSMEDIQSSFLPAFTMDDIPSPSLPEDEDDD